MATDSTFIDGWMQGVIVSVSNDLGDSHGGRVIKSLTANPERKYGELAALLVATLAQESDPRFGTYLDSVAGVSNSPQVVAPLPEIAEERPVYLRPKGSKYFARKWGKFWDVDILRQARDKNKPALLTGPPGTGKTAMAEAAWGDDLITTIISGDTRTSNLVGSFIPDGKSGYLWVDGPLTVAVREGRPILLDEILLADSKVLSILYSLMDGRGFLDVSDNPEIGIVPVKEGFYIIGAGNPNVPGARMSEALLSRFPLQVEVTTDWDLLEVIGLDETMLNIGTALDDRLAKGSITWAPQFREFEDFMATEKEWGRDFALANLLRRTPKNDREEVISLMTRSGIPARTLKPARI